MGVKGKFARLSPSSQKTDHHLGSTEYNLVGHRDSISGLGALQQVPCTSANGNADCTNEVCEDPACPDNFCEECFDYEKYCADCAGGSQDCDRCSNHEDSCQDCLDGDCTSECDNVTERCPEGACEYAHEYSPANAYNQYGPNHMLSPPESTAWPSQGFPNLHHNYLNSSFFHGETGIGDSFKVSRNCDGWASDPGHPDSGIELLHSAGAASFGQCSPYGAAACIHQQPSLAQSAYTSAIKASEPYHTSSSQSSPAHTPHPSIKTSTRTSLSSVADLECRGKVHHNTLACQWADEDGNPCGKTFSLGDEMHEHLREAHNTKSDVFCRWIGCSVNALGSHPHRYANSVQRHTWGHSGYRPYKCPACAEGFAAANIRDEHFSNIHLKEKTFRCDVCNHQCTSATNLKRHKDDKHRAERFQCEFCNRHGKIRLFPRAPNLARHFRKCKYVLATFPEADNKSTGKIDDSWYPPGYRKGHHGMDRAKVTPPKYLPI